MTITRTFKWYRTATSDPANSPLEVSSGSSSYTTVLADVNNYIHMKETATNANGSATATSNVVGPIAAAGTTYSPAAGTIAPIENGMTVYGTPLAPRIIRRTEQDVYDAEVLSIRPLCDLALNAASHTQSVASGLWSSSGTWSNGVPVAGMSVHINTGHTVTYDVESAAQLGYIVVDEGATLKWDITKDTHLVCDTLHGCPSAKGWCGDTTNPVPFSSTLGKPRVKIDFIGNIPGTQANNPGQTVSGSNMTLGKMWMGEFLMCGQQIKEKIDINSVPTANANTITATNPADLANWRVGDWVVVLGRAYSDFGPDPEYDGPTQYYLIPSYRNVNVGYSYFSNGFKQHQDELRQITAINAVTGVITLDSALTYAHPAHTTSRTLPVTPHALSANYGFTQGSTVTLPARVMNMSRSIEFESVGNLRKANGKINLLTRAHLMYHGSDRVDIRWFGCKNMARTSTDPSLTISESPPYQHPASSRIINGDNRLYADDACTINLADPNNVRGRYAIHLHGPGPLGDGARFNRHMRKLIGASAWATRGAPPQPGWVITHHAVNATIENCTVFFYRGAGIVTETGSEIGQWLNNTVAAGLGDGFEPSWATRQRATPNHNGHAGIAFECQARHILQHGNEASGSRIGWLFEAQQDESEEGLVRGPDPQSLRLFNPFVGGNAPMNDRDTYGLAASQVTDLHGCVGVDLDVMLRADHRVDIMRQDNTPFIALGWRCYGVNRIMNVENYSYNYFFRDFAYFGGNGGATSVAFQGTRSAQFGWRNGIIEGFARFTADSRHNHGPGWIDIATDMTQDPEDLSGAIKSSASMPNITPSFVMKSPPDPDMAFTLFGDNPNWGGQPMVTFRGTFTDGFSPSGRNWPFWQEDTAVAPESGGGFNTMQVSLGSHALEMVRRMGCYQVNGKYVQGGWFGTVDWRNFDPVWFKVEFPLGGNWPSGFLSTYTISPPAAPTWPLTPQDKDKPFPAISPPANISAPYIGGVCRDGGRLECVNGTWSGKPNDVDWFNYQWLRNGSTPLGIGRIYKPVAADVGQSITCQITAYNAGGVSATLTTAPVTPRAAYTGPTPQTIFGSALQDWWDIEDPDSIFDSYNPGVAYKPGVQMRSGQMMMGWAGNLTLTQFGSFGSNFCVLQNGWGTEKSRCATTQPVNGKQLGRHWTNLGSANDPIHLWVVVQRPNLNQVQFHAPVVMAAGHQTWISNDDTAQNVIGNTASGQTLATFPKGSRGVIYHGRDVNGQSWGFNNTRFTTANGPITDGNREVDLAYNGAIVDFKAVYWVKADNLTAQQHADMQAYLVWAHALS